MNTEADLHVHTTYSDGTLSPSELVDRAIENSLKAVAITDHDVMDGNEEARLAAEGRGLEVIPGVEISLEFAGGGMHMLGYFVSADSDRLNDELARIQEGREVRNRQIAERLRRLGIRLDYEEVLRIAGAGTVGRPHFAWFLVSKGVVNSVAEAFDWYLKRGSRAYVDRLRLGPKAAIEVIRSAGGVAVLAHPSSLRASPPDLESILGELRELGMAGLEVHSPMHTSSQTYQYGRLAEKLGLCVTAGTDFHGDAKPDVRLGIGRGNMTVPYWMVEHLRRASASGAP